MKAYRLFLILFLLVVAAAIVSCSALVAQPTPGILDPNATIVVVQVRYITATPEPTNGIVYVVVTATAQPSIEPSATAQSGNTWNGQDGYAIVGDTSTPRFYNWVEDFIKGAYPTAKISDHTSWKQAVLPDGLTISWAEWGTESLKLGQVDGIYIGKPVFVAMRNSYPWVRDSNVKDIKCSGTFIPKYEARMATWDVPQSTILQFDGAGSQLFVDKMTSAWNKIRAELGGCQ